MDIGDWLDHARAEIAAERARPPEPPPTARILRFPVRDMDFAIEHGMGLCPDCSCWCNVADGLWDDDRGEWYCSWCQAPLEPLFIPTPCRSIWLAPPDIAS